MDLVMILRLTAGILALIFFIYLVRDVWRHRHELPKKYTFLYSITGLYTCFLDAFGIGSMATSMATFKLTKSCQDDHLPGTGNVAFTISVFVEFFLFLGIIEVDPLTLLSMIASAVVGSLVGASFVTKWPVQVVRRVLAVTLSLVAIIMACRALGFGPFGEVGTATSLRGTALVIGIAGNFILGALQTMGIGLYAPCMALVSMLGMNLTAAFPIMMGSCAIVLPFCSMKFIKEGKYNRKASLIISITGAVGVLIAYLFVKSISLSSLVWLVVAVLFYTSYVFFKDLKKNSAADSASQSDQTIESKAKIA